MMNIGFAGFRLKESLLAVACAATLSVASEQADAVVLSFASIDTPSFAVFNGRLFMAYAGTDGNHRLNYAVSSDGLTYTQVTDGNNRSGGGPSIAAFNGKMFVAFPGINDHRINIASSTDGQHYSGQFVINPDWNTPWRPALGSGGGKLWLAWLGFDGALYTAFTTNGTNWTMGRSVQPMTGSELGTPFRSFVAYPPSLASDGTHSPALVYTWSQHRLGNPNQLQIIETSIDFTTSGVPICLRTSPPDAGIQAGVGFLGTEALVPWRVANVIQVDVNGGTCVGGGINYPGGGGSYGSTGVAPAAVGFNGHAYLGWTGTDGDQHINVVQMF